MALTTTRGFRDIFDPFEEMFRTFLPFSTSASLANRPSSIPPSRMDIIDKRDHYEVSVELPGVNKEDIQVHIDGGRLFLQASKSEEHREDNDRMYFSERSYGAIRRTVEMPGPVDSQNIQARFDNGVLKILIGKRDTAIQGQIIPVQ